MIKQAKQGEKVKLTPASVATGFPRRLSSVSSSITVLLIRDWMPGILDLITVSKCCNMNHMIKSWYKLLQKKLTVNILKLKLPWFFQEKKKNIDLPTFESTFARCSEPILGARCLYSGVLEKYSRSLRRAAIMSTFLLISACERFTTPIQGNFSR